MTSTDPAAGLGIELFEAVASLVPDCLIVVEADDRIAALTPGAEGLLHHRPGVGRRLAEALDAEPASVTRLLSRCRPDEASGPAIGVLVSGVSAPASARGLVAECVAAGGGRVLVRIRPSADGDDGSGSEPESRWSQELAEEATDLISRHAPDGTYRWVSPSARRLLGYGPDELVGTNAYGYFHPDDAAAIAEGSHAVILEGPDVATMTYRIRRKDGTYVWFETTSRSITDPDTGEAVEIIALSRDVTVRKETEDELRRLNQELEQFVAIASHDLASPLTTASGFVEMVVRHFGDDLPEEARLMLDRADAQLRHMADLLRDLLAYSRSAGSQLDRERIDVAALVVEVVDDLQLPASGVEVAIGSLPEVRADRTALRQIFENLFTNALKYARPEVPPRLEVSAARQPDGWRFDVVDNGIGVPPESREAIFGMFARGPGAGGRPGTGVGLAVVAKAVERHGGRVWVDDPPGGPGSRFRFTVPDAA